METPILGAGPPAQAGAQAGAERREDPAPGRRITAQAIAPGEQQLGDTLPQQRRIGLDLGPHLSEVAGNAQSMAARGKSLQMTLQQAGLAPAYGNGLEQPITVGQAPVALQTRG